MSAENQRLRTVTPVQLRIAKNAAANLTRGCAIGVGAIVLPAVLVRHMTPMDYAIWVLVLHVGAYCNYLELGLQTAVGRYVAIATERDDIEQRDGIFSTAVVGLAIAAVVAIVCLLGITSAAPWLFPGVPSRLVPTMQAVLLVVGISIAVGLPSLPWNGVFIGLQRQELSMMSTVGAKLFGAVGLGVAAARGASLLQMAIFLASVNFTSYFIVWRLGKRFSRVSFRRELVRRTVARELIAYCTSLTVWSMSTFLVSGLDLLLVGRFEVESLASYSIASTLMTLLAGVETAIFGAAMPHAAILHARRDSTGLGKMVVVGTRFGVFTLLIIGLPLLIYSSPLVSLWVGSEYSSKMHTPLTILLLANMVRLSALSYMTALVASGQQRLATLSPMLEGGSNLIASILLGIKFGAVGVAGGTLIGGIVGLLGHICYNIPRSQTDIHLSVSQFVISGLTVPLLFMAPLLLITVRAVMGAQPTILLFALVLIAELMLAAAIVARDLWNTRRSFR